MSSLRATVERAGPDSFADWEALHALLVAAFAPMEGVIDPPSSLRRLDPQGLRAKAAAETLLLIREDRAPVACLFAAPRGGELTLSKIAVRPDRRREGLCRALLAAAEAEARALGLSALSLETRIELRDTHAAFARLGFRRVGETAHPGHDRPTSVRMRRDLAPSEVSAP